MKKFFFLLLLTVSFAACKHDKKNEVVNNSTEDPRLEQLEADSVTKKVEQEAEKPKEYPAAMQAIFTAHGGLNHWKQMNNLCFEMKGKNGEETHTISLPDRKTKIESKDWSIGYDGTGVWLLKHDLGYKGNPVFYHNLMFYFYAMPFVLADPGTNYTAVEPTELDGKMYNGFKVSFNNGVGDSPKDEYKLFFDPETHKMVWLAYTVTFMDQKKSDDWHFIKYDKWQEVNGLLLPEKLTWWNVENGKPTDEAMDIKFKKISTTKTLLDPSVFKKPAEAEYVE
jgi:hypothetical protein